MDTTFAPGDSAFIGIRNLREDKKAYGFYPIIYIMETKWQRELAMFLLPLPIMRQFSRSSGWPLTTFKRSSLMKFVLYSDIGDESIKDSLGLPDYSYHFLRKAFEPLLAKIGEVVVIQGLDEVDQVYERCLSEGEVCTFFWFGPPNKTPLQLKCPIVPVFAWEFSNIPFEVWDEDPRNDWRHVFAATGRAISQSSHGVRVVKEAMGENYQVLSVPAPIWDRFALFRAEFAPQPMIAAEVELRVRGDVIDTRLMDLSPENELPVEMRTETILRQRRAPAPVAEPVEIARFMAGSQSVEPVEDLQKTARKGLLYRFKATIRHLLRWYRDAIRDLIPYRVVWGVSHIVRGLFAALGPIPQRQIWRRPSLKERLDATRLHYLLWYADVLGDIVPSWVSRPVSHALNGLYAIALAPFFPKAPPPPPPELPEVRFTIDGVIYTSVLNPTDGRKNIRDIITAFCWAFRDTPDATLILKMVCNDDSYYRPLLRRLLNQLSPMKCRVVAFHGFMEEPDFMSLIAASSYCVNASHGEGLCLPLIEFMSAGKPAIAPNHTAMGDYVTAEAAFIVKSSKECNVWPHDVRDLYRTTYCRINWESLRDAYIESYHVAHEAPEKYMLMSRAAIEAQRRHSETAIVLERMKAFLHITDEKRPIYDISTVNGPSCRPILSSASK